MCISIHHRCIRHDSGQPLFLFKYSRHFFYTMFETPIFTCTCPATDSESNDTTLIDFHQKLSYNDLIFQESSSPSPSYIESDDSTDEDNLQKPSSSDSKFQTEISIRNLSEIPSNCNSNIFSPIQIDYTSYFLSDFMNISTDPLIKSKFIYNSYLFKRDIENLLLFIPKQFYPNKDCYPCPLFPLCLMNFKDIDTWFKHIFDVHNDLLPYKEPFNQHISNFIPNLSNSTLAISLPSFDFPKALPCFVPYSNSCTKNNKDFFYHLIHHMNDNNDFSELLKSGCFFSLFVDSAHRTGVIPTYENIFHIPMMDNIIFLKKDIHFQTFHFCYDTDNSDTDPHDNNLVPFNNDNNNTNTPPWIGISKDSNIVDDLPILFEDGGLIVPSNHLSLEEGKLSFHKNSINETTSKVEDREITIINRDTNSSSMEYATTLYPNLVGNPPQILPFALSQCNDAPRYLKPFFLFLWKIVQSMNLMNSLPIFIDNSSDIHTTSYDLEIPQFKIKIVDYPIEVPQTNIKTRNTNIEMLK
ncbi:hypothetical protein TRFO_33293 [Tritrichomonas foetus]|uniref:Uncharacterized protein n=1 Tax=Tritrichomonas foetus TaxID=1144522 RepID=A0A1J4JRB9_9EUKA|nr:hypothetical protein TRFO_33293 [Tritrichomonas foetus]|eukprot:OHT00062.1 hypothetical protein TRFO_33293 [Tritrichomonas foetus]